MQFKRVLIIFSAAAIFLAACGDSSSGSSDADPALVAALATAISDSGSDGTAQFNSADATCAAEKIVSGLGAERLEAVGVTATEVGKIEDVDFSDGELDTVVGALGDCVDLPRLLADNLLEVGVLTNEDADCFAAEFSEDDLLPMFKAGLSDPDGDPPASFQQSFLDVAAECNFDLGF